MNVGTKSILFGAHAFWLHPWFVAWAWWKLYGFPWDPRLWVAFAVHDIGYWGKPNMDGDEGETHPRVGANIMSVLFDRRETLERRRHLMAHRIYGKWGHLVLFHSRFFAKRFGVAPSRLCIADKLAFCLTPRWLYLPMATASGEIWEYMKLVKQRQDAGEARYAHVHRDNDFGTDRKRWYDGVDKYMRAWVDEHKDGKADSWTPDTRTARDDNGVWQ